MQLSKAQYFQTGQDPASLKWRQINTPNFQIIYPDYFEPRAQFVSSIMEKVYKEGGKTLNYQPKKISIILHTQTVKSNGLVAWAPKRAEFYTIPHQGIYAQNWLEQLAIHEFRHMVQIDKINNELPFIIKTLLGEQGTALVFGAFIPWWFIEGDAVVAETAFSNSGRGRLPSFLMEHKALVVEKGNYKYDKAYNDSYKDYVPDHYQLGYYMVGVSREKYGADLWNSVLNRVGKKPFSLNPFNKSLIEFTGINKVQLYDSIFHDLKIKWMEEDKNFKTEKFETVTKKSVTYTNYVHNHWLNDSTIISHKSALNQTPSFVKIKNNGKENKIFTPGLIFTESVNFRGEWIVWSEQVPNPRWQHSGKSIIKLLNVENMGKRSVYPEFTAFAPSISPDKNRVVVVESNFSNDYFLSVYSIFDSKLMHRFQSENNNYFFSPEWLNEKEIIVVMLFPEGKRLAKLNLENNRIEVLLKKDYGEIKNIRIKDNNVYFVGSHSGKDILYRFDLTEQKVWAVYEPRFGLESPSFSPDGTQLAVSDYTSNGFRIIKLESSDLHEIEVTHQPKKKYSLADTLSKQETGVFDFHVVDSVQYESKKYKKFQHLLNFHSWAPAVVNEVSYEITPGVSFVSQNKLGTALLNMGYEWDVAGKTGNLYGKYTYKGWYPVLDFGVSSGNSSSKYRVIEQIRDKDGKVQHDTLLRRFTWIETNLSADVRVPLDLSRGKFNRFFQPEIRYDYTSYKHNSSTPEKFFQGNFQSMLYRIYYDQRIRMSKQDVFPNFGFVLDGIYRHSAFGDAHLGSLILGQTFLFLPGLKPNHGVRLFAGAQQKKYSDSFGFSEIIRYPRGWGKINTNNIASYSIDYKLPLFYPEWSVGGLAYLKRINASIYADYAFLNANFYRNGEIAGTFNSNISSYGIELSGNTNFLRFYAPVEIGIRTSYIPKVKNVFCDFLFSIDFTSL